MKKTKMSGSTRPHSNSYTVRNIPPPVLAEEENLAYASDDDLERHCRHLFSDKDHAARYGYDLTLWEVEICYVQREIQYRKTRREAHAIYLKEMSNELN